MYDADGDLSKEWFVHYHFLKPSHLQKPNESLYERFRVGNTINSYHTVKERKRQLRLVYNVIKKLLTDGFDPYKEYRLKDHVEYSGYLMTTCIDKYLDDIKADLKPNTYRKYYGHLELFKKYLKDTNREYLMIFQVSKNTIFDFLKHYQAEREWSNKNYNHYLGTLHSFFEHFLSNYDGYIKENVCSRIKRLQITRVGNRPFDNYDFPRTMDYVKTQNPYLYQFCRFIYYSCLRPDAELRKLQIWEIDLAARRMGVPGLNSKGKITQYIPIDDSFFEILNDMKLEQYPRHYYVFGKDGKPGKEPVHEKYFAVRFRPMKKALNLHPDINLYSLKHTRVIHLVEDGEKLHNIIQLTRHRTLAELMDYLKDMGVIIGEAVRLKSRSI